MLTEIENNNYFKYISSFFICLAFRLIPFRPPNIEPILTTLMPLSKKYSLIPIFLFGFLNMFIYDLITMHFGIWSIFTSFIYGLLGILSFYFFKNKTRPRLWDYGVFAIIGTLVFDSLTGLFIGPIFFNQNLMNALVGQIPFTLWHLLGNVSFSLILSPLIYDLFVYDKEKSINFIKNLELKKI